MAIDGELWFISSLLVCLTNSQFPATWDAMQLMHMLLCFCFCFLCFVTVTVYLKKYAHGFCFAVLCCGYTLTDFPISIRLTSLALWQSNDCPSASKATLMNMDKYFMWIHYERLHNHNKAKHNKTVCIFLGIYCMCNEAMAGGFTAQKGQYNQKRQAWFSCQWSSLMHILQYVIGQLPSSLIWREHFC